MMSVTKPLRTNNYVSIKRKIDKKKKKMLFDKLKYSIDVSDLGI